MSAYRKLSDDELPAAAAIITETFLDISLRWLGLNDTRIDRRIVGANYLAMLQAITRDGFVAADDGLNAIAAWAAPPGAGSMVVEWRDTRVLRRAYREKFGWAWWWKMAQSKLTPHSVPHDPHAYLAYFATRPTVRDNGHGSALLAATLRDMDTWKTPTYVNTISESAVRFYERHGFQIRERVPATAVMPAAWGLWRDPPK